jgi:hypothetical protein
VNRIESLKQAGPDAKVSDAAPLRQITIACLSCFPEVS